MQKSFLPVTRLFVATVAGVSFASLLMAQPSFAQLNRTDVNTGGDFQGSPDVFSPDSGNFNPLDLIHRAQFGNINWNAEQQNQQLDSAAAQFRAKQQQLMQNQTQQQPANPTQPAVTGAGNTSPAQILTPNN